jgi:hypothetical protein
MVSFHFTPLLLLYQCQYVPRSATVSQLSATGRVASLWLAWAFLVTIGRAWPLFHHLTPSVHHLHDVRGGDDC